MSVAADPWSQRLQAALALAQRGAPREAVAAFIGLIAERPREALPHVLLATLWHQLGDLDAALRELETAESLAPTDPRAPQIHAHLLLAAGRHVDAEAAARRALALAPGHPHAQFDLACALQGQQRWDAAATAAEALLAQAPMHAEARRLLVRCRLMDDCADAALAVALHPSVLDTPALALAVAADFAARGAREPRLALLRALAGRHPQDYAVVLSLADALHAAGHAAEALAWSDRAEALQPRASKPRQMRAISLIDRGEPEAGLALYRALVEQGTLDAIDEQRYLIVAHYDPAPEPSAMYAAHLAWAQRHVKPFGPPFAAAPPGGRLRIGWLSPRFSEGPVARFFTGLLRAFDREHHAHVLIELEAHRDACTEALEALADEVLAVHALDDDTLLARLREARLDVLIDLAGHAPFSRPQVLAQRVAPLQLCWLDYFDSTGLPNIDGWISDRWLSPPDSPQRFRERLLHLPGGRFCYTPPPFAPEPQRVGGGAPVFASFNRIAKLHDGVLDAWARILAALPQARLLIGAAALEDAAARGYLRDRLARRGIDAARLELRGRQSYAELLSAYRQADIALDPFPFSGCTTSCDALWMGLPVVTLPGWSVVSRQSASLAWRLDRPQWVAHDADDYVARAVALGRDVETLRTQREALRREVERRLCDASAHAAEFAALLRGLVDERWREHPDAGADAAAGDRRA
ncbi:MAG TPA: tetratricopeptide repeat protein [Mizugakiibacter sp.]